MADNEKLYVKHIADIVGEWGKWQFHLATYCFILYIFYALNNMGYSFHAFNNDYWCNDVPKYYKYKTGEMKCFKYLNPSESCTKWQYDRTQFHNSINTEFDLVCNRKDYASISQAFYMFGYLVSGLVFSHYSDKYGRRPICWISFTIEIFGIFLSTFANNIYVYTISRLLVGLGTSGRGMAIGTTLFECCGPKYRAAISILATLGWVLGYILVPALAYWLQDFRYMNFVSGISMILMSFWYYFLYESPRWQITNGQTGKAEETLRRALELNGKHDENLGEQLNNWSTYLKETESEVRKTEKHSALDLFRTPTLRRITLIMWFNNAVNSLTYYGLSLNMADFGGNFYISFMLSGIVELPSKLLCVFLMRFIGRRKLFALTMFITVFSCFAVIPSQAEWLKVTLALIGKFGVTSARNVMGTHCPELYPTVIRHTGIGVASVVSRIGSISAPFMKNLAANTSLSVVMVLYGTLTAIGAIIGLFLPETKDREIPDTIEEAENIGAIAMKTIKI